MVGVTKNRTQPSLGKGGFGFPFGKITCYTMKRGLVPLTRESLVLVLKDNITWLRKQAEENNENKNA